MKNLEELIELENRLKPVLLENHYTMIAPVDRNDLSEFIKIANKNIDGITIHNVLSNSNGIRTLLNAISYPKELRIYIMIPVDENTYIHGTIEDYIERFNIKFKE